MALVVSNNHLLVLTKLFWAEVPIFVEHWGGGIICNFTPILPYFQHWGGGEPRPRYCSGEEIKLRQKKGLQQKWSTFFPKFKWTPTLRCTPYSDYRGRCKCRPYSNHWGIYPPILPGLRHPWFWGVSVSLAAMSKFFFKISRFQIMVLLQVFA